MSSVLSELDSKLKMIMRLRPQRSVRAPPNVLPIALDTKNSANSTPTSDMPTLNLLVMYSAKNGKSSAPAQAIDERDADEDPEGTAVFVVQLLILRR